MGIPAIEVTRNSVRLTPDPSRVIVRPFIPGDIGRVPSIVDRVLSMPDSAVSSHLGALLEKFAPRHPCLHEAFEQHFEEIRPHIGGRGPFSVDRCRLLGAYFTKEYSLESVALFNPSMVLHPDQGGMRNGQVRFIMSLRACGEGHISSIEFRTGVIDETGGITMDEPTPFAASQRPVDDRLYDKARFRRKLVEMGAYNPLADGILDAMGDQFTSDEFNRVLETFSPAEGFRDTFAELAEMMRWLVHSTYHLRFSPTTALSERVIFPVTENESRGIEDARFVRFVDDDGTITFFATYTAYNGFRTLPQFLETSDFCHFKIFTFNGSCAQNKGQALFPRKIRGDYWMVSRLDGENLYLLWSDNVHFWNEGKELRGPAEPWEFVQIGNCGSPIETDEGWLVLTHGVGPMRQYWLGAMLLDLDDPFRVIGRLEHPLLMPTEEERNGYVPNVLYSCGAMVHQDRLIIPYAAADTYTSVATVSLSDLLAHLRR